MTIFLANNNENITRKAYKEPTLERDCSLKTFNVPLCSAYGAVKMPGFC